MMHKYFSSLAILPLLALLGCAATNGPPERLRASNQLRFLDVDELERSTHQETFAALHFIDDPIAPVNRFSLRITKPVIDWVVVPVAKGYRFVVPTPARLALDRASYNLTYPSRFVSLLLQGEIEKAGRETGHFLTNTTLGVAGLFDPAASFGMPTYPEDVGLAFARWGVGHGFYLFLPFLGPSSGRDAVGQAFDLVLNPLFWVPAPGIAGVPFLNAATGASLAIGVNAFSFRIDGYETLTEEFSDLYHPTRALWSIQRQIQVDKYRIPAEAYETADPEPSLGVLLFTPDDPRFASRSVKRRAKIAATGRRLPYSIWMQRKPAPLLFLLPGVGAHRLGAIPVGIAEAAFARGYSVVSISSPLHPEFIVAALTAAYPGYTPSDAEDIQTALTRIWRDLRSRYGSRITEANLLGYSLGAIETLFLAAAQAQRPAGGVEFKRFVAINPPVDLLHSGRQFDAYFDAPLQWSRESREANIREVVMKAFLMATEGLPQDAPPPFDRIESEFLIGFAGRATLANSLAMAERLGAPGLDTEIADDGRNGVLADSILRTSFVAFFEQLALPYFAARSPAGLDAAAMAESAGLRSHADALRARCDAYVVTNADDFILGAPGLAWLRDTFADRLTVFPSGGHLGNIHTDKVQEEIFARLAQPACR